MSVLIPVMLAACGPTKASDDTGLETDADTDTDTDTDTDSDTDSDTDTDADSDTDADTDTGATTAGAWVGSIALDVQEGGFALNEGTCSATLMLDVPPSGASLPATLGSFVCTASNISDASFTLVADAVSDTGLTGVVTATVSGWPSGSVAYTASLDRGTLRLDVPTGGMTEGEWSYGWQPAVVTLSRP